MDMIGASRQPRLGARAGTPAGVATRRRSGPPLFFVAAAFAALLAAGCASTRIDAQWLDPQWPKGALRGAAVLVVCDAQDTTVKLLCESRFSARWASLGLRPLAASAAAEAPAGREAAFDGSLAAAQAAGARAVLQTTLKPDFSAASAGPSFSIGIGGFGASGGGSRSGVGGGVGIAVPVGAPAGAGLAASSSLVDAGSGKVIWSARATAPAASDLAAQIDELASVLADAAKQSAIF